MRYHSPFASELEGIIARGDERVGGLIEKAFKRGARFDGWDEHLDRRLWKSVLEESGWDPGGEFCSGRGTDEPLVWDCVHLGVSKAFLKEEFERSQKSLTSQACGVDCGRNCGVCGKNHSVRVTNAYNKAATRAPKEQPSEYTGLLMFSFEKQGKAVFLSHLNVMSGFERAFQRSGLRVKYTQGYNPKPKLEFASPLSLGFHSEDEIGRVEVVERIDPDLVKNTINRALCEGIRISYCTIVDKSFTRKQKSLMSRYWGGEYLLEWIARESDQIEDRVLSLSRYKTTNGLEDDIIITRRSDGVVLRVRQAGKKTSLRAILSALSDAGKWWDEWQVTRLKSLAIGGTGKDKSIPVPFL